MSAYERHLEREGGVDDVTLACGCVRPPWSAAEVCLVCGADACPNCGEGCSCGEEG